MQNIDSDCDRLRRPGRVAVKRTLTAYPQGGRDVEAFAQFKQVLRSDMAVLAKQRDRWHSSRLRRELKDLPTDGSGDPRVWARRCVRQWQ